MNWKQGRAQHGSFGQGGPIVTAGGLVFIAGTIDKTPARF